MPETTHDPSDASAAWPPAGRAASADAAATHGLPPTQASQRIDTPPLMLLAGLAGIFLLVWLAPPLVALQQSDRLFPVALHTVMETAAVVVAFLIFAVSWHSHLAARSGVLVVLGLGFLAVGLFDVAHMLSYKGMPDFVTPASVEKAIDFWLLARYVAAFTLLTAALQLRRQTIAPAMRWLLLGAVLAGVALAGTTRLVWAPEIFPRTFIDGQGLTPFKIAAEYGIVALLIAAAWLFLRDWRRAAGYDAAALFTAAVVMVLCELCFTLYSNVNSIFSLLGHVYKVIAYGYLYRAVVVAGVRAPYEDLRREVGIRRDAEQRIEYLAYHDALTGLPNRRLAADRFQRDIAHAQRAGSKVALIFIDLDGFKSINDSLGHAAGDALLKTMAQRLAGTVRATDTVSRQGGDEFLIVATDLPDADDLLPLLGKLMQGIQQPISRDGQELVSSASLGVALYPDDGGDFETLLKKADMAMYRAKDVGRNAWRFFDPRMDAELQERLALRSGLRQALEEEGLVLHYQPVVCLATGRVVAVEALLRWRKPDGQLVPPARFIPVAEESGLIVPIGDWVLREACGQAARWIAQGLGGLRVGVNLSVLQFSRGDVEASVAASLQAHGLSADALTLEVTESILISDPEAVVGVLQRLKAQGVHVAIDDFGTGYSSLSYLKRLSVDALKIDRSFVSDLAKDPEDTAIVEAVITLARSLGLRTVAEGVEDEATARHLQALGCDLAQGYLYARPLPAAEITPMLQVGSSRFAGLA